MADLLAPKPLYRSRLFWLGVPGLVFLLWAWGTVELRLELHALGVEQGKLIPQES